MQRGLSGSKEVVCLLGKLHFLRSVIVSNESLASEFLSGCAGEFSFLDVFHEVVEEVGVADFFQVWVFGFHVDFYLPGPQRFTTIVSLPSSSVIHLTRLENQIRRSKHRQ